MKSVLLASLVILVAVSGASAASHYSAVAPTVQPRVEVLFEGDWQNTGTVGAGESAVQVGPVAAPFATGVNGIGQSLDLTINPGNDTYGSGLQFEGAGYTQTAQALDNVRSYSWCVWVNDKGQTDLNGESRIHEYGTVWSHKTPDSAWYNIGTGCGESTLGGGMMTAYVDNNTAGTGAAVAESEQFRGDNWYFLAYTSDMDRQYWTEDHNGGAHLNNGFMWLGYEKTPGEWVLEMTDWNNVASIIRPSVHELNIGHLHYANGAACFDGLIDNLRIFGDTTDSGAGHLTPENLQYIMETDVVPEPASLLILALGGTGFLVRRNRRIA